MQMQRSIDTSQVQVPLNQRSNQLQLAAIDPAVVPGLRDQQAQEPSPNGVGLLGLGAIFLNQGGNAEPPCLDEYGFGLVERLESCQVVGL